MTRCGISYEIESLGVSEKWDSYDCRLCSWLNAVRNGACGIVRLKETEIRVGHRHGAVL